MTGIKFVRGPQGLFVVTDAKYNRADRPHSWPEIRPHDTDDATIFENDPLAAYIIREWRFTDAGSEHERSDLLEMHCLTIVFRSGWRKRVACLFNKRSVLYPVDRAYCDAENLIAERDARIGPFWDLPHADVSHEVRLMGLAPEEAVQAIEAREARIRAQEPAGAAAIG